jgi:glucose/arabinose dehydrogenase
MEVKRDTLFSRGLMVRCAAVTVHMLGALLLAVSPSAAQGSRQAPAAAAEPCAGTDSGITLPPGFCATVFADNIGHARQMVVAPNGVLYVNTWSGTYFRNDTPRPADSW